MLSQFITTNRLELIRLCRETATKRRDVLAFPPAPNFGIPLFLQQLVDTLDMEQRGTAPAISEPEEAPSPSEVGRTAALHGAELLRLGFTIGQVVHEYGDVCQAVTGLAVELGEPITSAEFRTLNCCLDNAIADAVTAFTRAGHALDLEQTATLQVRVEAFVWEQARLIDTASQAFSAIRTGGVGTSGATGQLLGHVLSELRYHCERTLPQLHSAIAPPESAADNPQAATIRAANE